MSLSSSVTVYFPKLIQFPQAARDEIIKVLPTHEGEGVKSVNQSATPYRPNYWHQDLFVLKWIRKPCGLVV